MKTLSALLLTLVLAGNAPAADRHAIDIGPWVVHWSAFTGDTLSPEMARNYDITRSGRNAVLNISVLENGGERKPVAAEISGSATNLVGQKVKLEFTPVRETGALYYLAQWTVAPEENVLIRLKVKPEGARQAFDVSFRQVFYPDRR